jgi:hypothetical protein
VALALGGCVPRVAPVAVIEPAALEARYRAGLERRTAVLNGVEADVLVWLAVREKRRPGVEASLLLAGDDAFRFRVASLFGTALDLSLEGSRVLAYAPAERAVLSMDASGEPFRLAGAGGLLASAWSGTWRAPGEAWSRPEREDSLLVLEWPVSGERLRLGVGPSGLPRRVRVARGDGSALELDYLAWERRDGVDWPVHMECRDAAETFEARVRVRRFRFGARDPRSLESIVPEDARAVAWEEFATLLGLRSERG